MSDKINREPTMNNNIDIKEIAKNLEKICFDDTRHTFEYANKKIDTFASLLILIAFSSIGLSIQLLEKDNLDTSIIRWGIILLILSIISGLSQLILDYRHFTNLGKICQKRANELSMIANGVINESEIIDVLEQNDNLPDNSNIYSLYIEIFFVFVGSSLILSQLLF